MDFLRPILGRLIGSAVGAGAAYVASKWGTVIDAQGVQQVTDAGVAIAVGAFGVIYSLVHKAVSAKVNPADAATPKLSAEGKIEQKSASF